jgi:hypothetical protein
MALQGVRAYWDFPELCSQVQCNSNASYSCIHRRLNYSPAYGPTFPCLSELFIGVILTNDIIADVMLILSFNTDIFILIAGVSTFRALSPIMAYSVCLYALVNTTTYFGVRYKIIPFFKNNDEFENLVYMVMLILVVLTFVLIPVFAWLDAPKTVQYLEEWKKFQACTDVANVAGQPAMVREGWGRLLSDGIYG